MEKDQERTPYKTRVWMLVLLTTAVRAWIAFHLELGSVEAYYWEMARHLQLNYFDHPPLVAWLIRATTLNLALQQEGFVRLGAVLSSAVCTYICFQIGRFLTGA